MRDPLVHDTTRHFQPVARWLTVAAVVLILYGTLFPFRFAALGASGFFELLPGLTFQRTSRGGVKPAALHAAGFVPAASWPPRWGAVTRLFWTVMLGTMLSCAIEMLQVHAPSRVSSLTDVVLNASGALAGGLIALAYLEIGSTIRIPGIAPGKPEPVPLGILLLWLGFRLAPFVPSIDWQKFKDPQASLPRASVRRAGYLSLHGGLAGSRLRGATPVAVRVTRARCDYPHRAGWARRDRRQSAGGAQAPGAGAVHSVVSRAGRDARSAPRGPARVAARERHCPAGAQAVRAPCPATLVQLGAVHELPE